MTSTAKNTYDNRRYAIDCPFSLQPETQFYDAKDEATCNVVFMGIDRTVEVVEQYFERMHRAMGFGYYERYEPA